MLQNGKRYLTEMVTSPEEHPINLKKKRDTGGAHDDKSHLVLHIRLHK